MFLTAVLAVAGVKALCAAVHKLLFQQEDRPRSQCESKSISVGRSSIALGDRDELSQPAFAQSLYDTLVVRGKEAAQLSRIRNKNEAEVLVFSRKAAWRAPGSTVEETIGSCNATTSSGVQPPLPASPTSCYPVAVSEDHVAARFLFLKSTLLTETCHTFSVEDMAFLAGVLNFLCYLMIKETALEWKREFDAVDFDTEDVTFSIRLRMKHLKAACHRSPEIRCVLVSALSEDPPEHVFTCSPSEIESRYFIQDPSLTHRPDSINLTNKLKHIKQIRKQLKTKPTEVPRQRADSNAKPETDALPATTSSSPALLESSHCTGRFRA